MELAGDTRPKYEMKTRQGQRYKCLQKETLGAFLVGFDRWVESSRFSGLFRGGPDTLGSDLGWSRFILRFEC